VPVDGYKTNNESSEIRCRSERIENWVINKLLVFQEETSHKFV